MSGLGFHSIESSNELMDIYSQYSEDIPENEEIFSRLVKYLSVEGLKDLEFSTVRGGHHQNMSNEREDSDGDSTLAIHIASHLDHTVRSACPREHDPTQ